MIGDVTFYPNYFHYEGFSRSAEPSITLETYTSSGGETSGPAYDLVDFRRDNVVTTDSNGQTTNVVIDMDLTSNITDADFVIIDNHNFNTAGADVQIAESSGNKNITGYEASGLGVTTSASTNDGTAKLTTPTDGILLVNITTAVTGNDWQIGLEENGATFDADITIGQWFVGKKCTPSRPANDDFSEGYSNEGIFINRTGGGLKYGFKRFAPKKFWQLTFEHLTDTDKDNLEELWLVTDGQLRPFYVDLGEETTPKLYFVRFAMDRMSFVKEGTSTYRLTIQLEEE